MSQVSGLVQLFRFSQPEIGIIALCKKTFPVVWHHAEVRQLGKERDDPLV